MFEKQTRYLAQATDRILRKHGKNIIGKQFATKRLAEIMIDLFVLACTLSRVQASIESNGVEKAAKEIEILQMFAREARVSMKQNFRRIDNNDDDIESPGGGRVRSRTVSLGYDLAVIIGVRSGGNRLISSV